ncbi:TSSC1 [Branchiostoma lanceolatum]|uniref:TSSC1 protein n=1 Tax=Branchiostoma lanceolatum TaxID=7740 RepID=A0A8J9ZL85_BRALA|nr:TSSC1 [Branchiostoma lanceolatum]
MDDDAPVIYGLEFQARALTPQVAETDAIRFLVGTQSLKFENQIHQIDFDDENNILNKNVFLHQPGEVWHVSASPADKAVLTTVYNKTSEQKAEMCGAVWRIPSEFDASANDAQDDASASAQALELLCHLDDGNHSNMVSTVWEPAGDGKKLISLTENNILMWDLDVSSSQAKLSSSATLEGKGNPKFTAGRWNPHHNCTQMATANDTTIRGWDVRTMQQVYCIDNAHGQLVRELDFNPNKQYYLVSCGDDCNVKFWDVRNSTEPVLTLSEHSHWVWSVRYNHFHDQLVLTSSSDSRVILHNMVSISSEPFGHLIDEDDDSEEDEENKKEKPREPEKDGVIGTYEEHEDSVYAAEWSTADPWLFASLSYDGRLVINRVPKAVKYKILL